MAYEEIGSPMYFFLYSIICYPSHCYHYIICINIKHKLCIIISWHFTILQWWVDTGRHQAVLCGCREGGMEVWHTVWLVWHTDHHSGCDLLQHQEEGGLAHTEDAGSQLHSQLHARRHAPEGERQYYEGIPFWSKVYWSDHFSHRHYSMFLYFTE